MSRDTRRASVGFRVGSSPRSRSVKRMNHHAYLYDDGGCRARTDVRRDEERIEEPCDFSLRVGSHATRRANGVSRVRSKRGFERQSKMSTPTTTTRRAIDSHRFFASYRGPIALATTKQSRENPHGGCSAPRRGLTNGRVKQKQDVFCTNFTRRLQTLVRLSRKGCLLRRGGGTNRILDLTLDAHRSL